MDVISNRLIEHLESGGVVAYPTSTLPGLGCLPTKNGLDSLFIMNVKLVKTSLIRIQYE